MSEGMAGIRRAAASRGSGGNASYLIFKVKPGATETVRFIDVASEIDKQWCYMHKMPPQQGQKWGDDLPCLDQAGDGSVPCPGCERQLPKKIIGYVNLIWRNGPVMARKEDGSIDWKSEPTGRADVLAVWNVGISKLEELDAIDRKYRGITTRDFDVNRNTATGFDVRYRVDPHIDSDGNSAASPFSEADQKLAAKKSDLKVLVQPPSYETMAAKLFSASQPESEGGDGDDGFESGFDRAAEASPFAKRT